MLEKFISYWHKQSMAKKIIILVVGFFLIWLYFSITAVFAALFMVLTIFFALAFIAGKVKFLKIENRKTSLIALALSFLMFIFSIALIPKTEKSGEQSIAKGDRDSILYSILNGKDEENRKICEVYINMSYKIDGNTLKAIGDTNLLDGAIGYININVYNPNGTYNDQIIKIEDFEKEFIVKDNNFTCTYGLLTISTPFIIDFEINLHPYSDTQSLKVKNIYGQNFMNLTGEDVLEIVPLDSQKHKEINLKYEVLVSNNDLQFNKLITKSRSTTNINYEEIVKFFEYQGYNFNEIHIQNKIIGQNSTGGIIELIMEKGKIKEVSLALPMPSETDQELANKLDLLLTFVSLTNPNWEEGESWISKKLTDIFNNKSYRPVTIEHNNKQVSVTFFDYSDAVLISVMGI